MKNLKWARALSGLLIFALGLATGFTGLNLRDVPHGGFKVVGDTPLKLFTVHIVDKGKPLYDYVK